MTGLQPSLIRRVATVALLVLLGSVLTPLAASAHVERPSYRPNPKPDCAVSPCAGGKVPEARTLRSALDDSRRGQTRVVCKQDSMKRLRASVRRARVDGYDIRPTDHRSLSRDRAQALLKINERLFDRCAFHRIQRAV